MTAYQTYRLRTAEADRSLKHMQAIAENTARDPNERMIASNEALRIRADLHRLRVEAANG